MHNPVRYLDYEGMSTDLDERERLAESLGDQFVLILRNHGLLTANRSVGEVFVRMYYLERACTVQMQVLASGRPYRKVSQKLQEHVANQGEQHISPGLSEWPALLNLVENYYPDFRG